MSQPLATVATPTAPGKYKAIAELGRGGMATVYLAVVQGPAGFNKLQVVKRLRPSLAADPEFLTMFVEEARLAARITHPNVVQTNEVGFDGQYYFIAMEYLDGQTLEAISRKVGDGAMPLPMQLHVLCQTLAGLHHAHELTNFDGSPLNVVHRDVSPHNIIVTYDGHVKILDFGIAKAADSSADTRTGIMKGKCGYMAPEQFGGPVDRRADIFAAGIVLWQALTGARLWGRLSDAEIFAKLSMGDIRRPRSVKSDVSEVLDDICMKALAVNRDDRYATAADLQAALESYLETVPRVTPRELGNYVRELFAQNRAAIRAAIEAELSKPAVPANAKSGDVPVLWQLVPDAQTTASEEEAAAPPRGARGARLALYGLVAVAAISVGLYAARRKNASAAKMPPPPIVASSGPAAPTPALVHFSLRATPDEAKVFLDDVPLPTNPGTGSFVKDGASHRIRVEAPGYVTKRDFVVFDQGNVDMEVALEKERPQAVGAARVGGWGGSKRSAPATTAAEAPQPVAAPPPPSPPPPTPAPPAEPKKPVIDTSDPWSGKKGP